MSPPRNENGDPRAAGPGNRHQVAAATAKQQGAPTRIVSPGGKKRRAARRREAMTARVSLLVPDEQRTWWHYLARCPVCGRPHLGRSRELAGVTSTRKLPCGHWVVIVVARSYGQTSPGAAA
jgi:hypothetical protein